MKSKGDVSTLILKEFKSLSVQNEKGEAGIGKTHHFAMVMVLKLGYHVSILG